VLRRHLAVHRRVQLQGYLEQPCLRSRYQPRTTFYYRRSRGMNKTVAKRKNDFSLETKRAVAGRVGYRCSIPSCGRVTIGPDSLPDRVANTGRAAHIFSAAERGPRGQGGLTAEQLQSARNGIWLCAEHADLVDKNRGERYPAPLLLSYKDLQEAKIAREQRAIFAPMGWFQQIVIHASPLFESRAALQFGKVTLIVGPNFIGKSALCDWLAGFGDPAELWRWLPNRYGWSELDIEVLCHMPEQNTVRLKIADPSPLRFWINDKESPIQPLPLRFVFLKEERLSKEWDDVDDLDLICAQLNVDPVTLPSLFPFVDSAGFGWVRNLRFVDETEDDDTRRKKKLYADVRGTKPGLCFRVLSHSEQTCLLIELAVALARVSSQFIPTMLLLDGGMSRLGPEKLNELATELAAPQHLFQTVIVLPNAPKDSAKLRWAGWEMVQLEKGANGAVVSQQPP
jgi:hypothetical protein